MPSRAVPARTLAVLLALAALLPRAALSQPHGDGPPRSRGSAADTTDFFPYWLHPWVEIGGGWLAAPASMKHFYDSGQGFAAGLSTAPWRRVGLRASVDYQSLQSHHQANYVIDWGAVYGGPTVLDTVSYAFDTNAWSMLLRGEAGVQPGFGLWATGGFGAGYMNGGFEDLANIPGSGFRGSVPETMRNGWGWAWTAAVRWDVEPDPMIPFGLEARTTAMKRGSEFVRWWSVRLLYRIPDPRSRNTPR